MLRVKVSLFVLLEACAKLSIKEKERPLELVHFTQEANTF